MSHVLLITGGSRGIGRATAERAARQGFDVAIGWRSGEPEAQAAVAAVEAAGRRAVAIQGDVAREADILRLFETTERTLGPVTALVNSAGISRHSSVADAERALLEELLAVNVTGLILCCREAVRRMSTALGGQGGAIVNISSMAAATGGRPGLSLYAASKGAVDSFTLGLAREVARAGIRVNGVRPGMTMTDMTANVRDDAALKATVAAGIPMGRVGEAAEIAEAVVWLLTPQASFVTGTVIDVAGGGFVIGSARRD